MKDCATKSRYDEDCITHKGGFLALGATRCSVWVETVEASLPALVACAGRYYDPDDDHEVAHAYDEVIALDV